MNKETTLLVYLEFVMNGDKRIPGHGDFVATVLRAAREKLERKSMIRAKGCDFDWLLERVTDVSTYYQAGVDGRKATKNGQGPQRIMRLGDAGTGDERDRDVEKNGTSLPRRQVNP
ncbi:MAG: hypothetical protein U5R30_01115 [Deltaproteobacteria bacterium]|nr:hypothetical protein [Deltaproteobacteria bacterium]